MSISTTCLLLGLCSLGLAAIGCREPLSAVDAEGTIDFVVRPIEDVGSVVPRGSFEVRGIDNDEHARVGIGSSGPRTLSIRLPAGAYSVAWQPSGSTSSRWSATERDEATPEWPQIVLVAPESAATVDVFVAAQSSRRALASATTTL